MTATAFVADNSNLAVSVASLAITLSVQVIVQPPVVASYRGYLDIAENYRGIIGTVSASGGYRSGGGDITYHLLMLIVRRLIFLLPMAMGRYLIAEAAMG